MQLNQDQIDALEEIINIGVGRAASTLYDMIEQHIELRVPKVIICDETTLSDNISGAKETLDTSVAQGFDGAISGKAMLAFPESSGTNLAKMLSDPDIEEDELESDLAGILEEVGNIFLNSVLGSIANLFEDDFQYTVPEVHDGVPVSVLLTSAVNKSECFYLVADTRFDVADSEISGSLLLVFNTGEFSSLLDKLCQVVEG